MQLTYLDELLDALRSFCFRGVRSPRLGRNRYDRCTPEPGRDRPTEVTECIRSRLEDGV